MWRVIGFFVVSILALFCVSIAFTCENAGMSKQVATIVEFLELLGADTQPKTSDFFRFFGRENESELELILKQQFPKLSINQIWFSDQEALEYVNRVYDNPSQHVSRFMECLRKTNPELFLCKTKHKIEYFKERSEDFKKFKVTNSGKTMIFQFSGRESLIDNIYLPEGKSIYTLIEECGRNP
jgi:hypothetical protein